MGDRLILATAGHIDHGKTSLLRALTGIDTDRLPEEKARGISIDLGFAHLPLPGGGSIAFVDVPGHERFLRTMLAGIGQAGAALLVVAADDGVMPQTIEHVEILDLLGIPGAAIAITKCDRADAARIAAVRRQVASLVEGGSLAGAPVLETSATTGAGIDGLRAACIAAAGARDAAAAARVAEPFRYVVDRAFSITGSGTVVTGTVLRGQVRAGDALLVSPAGIPVRVRGIQAHGAAVPEARAGQRCALNLAGIERDQVQRGDWLLPPALHRPTSRMDVALRVAALGEEALRHWAPVVLHLGARAVPARLRLRRGASLPAGGLGDAQLVLEEAVAALRGERFILRDAAGRRTLAGGRILDPFAPSRPRATRPAELDALRQEAPGQALAALLAARAEGFDPEGFAIACNLDAGGWQALLARGEAVMLGKGWCLALTAVEALKARLLARLQREASAGPGVAVAALRRLVAPSVPEAAFALLLRQLAAAGAVDVGAGGLVRLPLQAAQATLARQDQRRALRDELERLGTEGVPAAGVPGLLRAPPAFLRALLEAMRRDGEAHVIADRWYAAAAVQGFAATATALARSRPEGFIAAQFRDAAGIGRNRTIEVLEYLDAIGVTRRHGAARSLATNPTTLPGASNDGG